MQAGTSNGRTQVVSRESVGFLLFFLRSVLTRPRSDLPSIVHKQEQTLFNDLRQGPCKGKKDLCIKEGVPLHFKIIVRKERVDQRYFIPATFFRTINLE